MAQYPVTLSYPRAGFKTAKVALVASLLLLGGCAAKIPAPPPLPTSSDVVCHLPDTLPKGKMPAENGESYLFLATNEKGEILCDPQTGEPYYDGLLMVDGSKIASSLYARGFPYPITEKEGIPEDFLPGMEKISGAADLNKFRKQLKEDRTSLLKGATTLQESDMARINEANAAKENTAQEIMEREALFFIMVGGGGMPSKVQVHYDSLAPYTKKTFVPELPSSDSTPPSTTTVPSIR